MAEKTPAGTVLAVGHRNQEAQSGSRVLPQWLRRDPRRRIGSHSDRGPASPVRKHAGLAKRQVREGGPLHVRREADRRPVWRGVGGALPLEGFRPEPQRNPGLGGGWHRAGLPALGHQVQCQAARPPLVQARRAVVRVALEEREVSAERGLAGARRAGCGRAGRGGPRIWVLSRVGGGTDSLRDGRRRSVRRGAPAPVQGVGVAESHESVGRAVRAVEGFRRERRRPGRHARDLALRRAWQAPRRLRSGRPVRRIIRWERDRAPAERLPGSRRPLASSPGRARAA